MTTTATSNKETFTKALTEVLTEHVTKFPERYVLGDNTIADFVQRDVKALTETLTETSLINIGPVHRIAAKKCGIKQTAKAIHAYLLKDNTNDQPGEVLGGA